MAIDFEIALEDAGWARAAVLDGSRRLDTMASYLTDPIGALATLAQRYVNGFGIAEIPIVYEPGAYVCRFVRDRDRVFLIIPDDRDNIGGPANSAAPIVFEASENHRVFAVNVCRLLDGLWRRHGVLGYRRRWDRAEFPLLQYLYLRLMFDRSPLAQRIAEGSRAGVCTRALEVALIESAADLSPDREPFDFGYDFRPADL